MAERGTEKMTEWLDIKLDSLSAEERLHLIEEDLTPSLRKSFAQFAIWQSR